VTKKRKRLYDVDVRMNETESRQYLTLQPSPTRPVHHSISSLRISNVSSLSLSTPPKQPTEATLVPMLHNFVFSLVTLRSFDEECLTCFQPSLILASRTGGYPQAVLKKDAHGYYIQHSLTFVSRIAT
jgi:hypothetical protein